MPSGPLSPTSARGSSGASANGTGSRSLHARVAELNKKMEEIFKSSKTPKFQEILFFGGGRFFLWEEEELGGDENVDFGWVLLGVYSFFGAEGDDCVTIFWLQRILSNCTRERERERHRQTDRELFEHHTNNLIDWKHWTRSSDLLIDVGSSFHSESRQFNDQGLLNASVAPGIGTRRLVLVRSAYILFLQIECWFSRK